MWLRGSIIIILLLSVTCQSGWGQIVPNPIKGRTVGLYFSKKGFVFSSEYNQLFAALLQHEDSLDLSEENLKTAASIAFGNFLCRSFDVQLGTDAAVFLNSNPKMAKSVIAAYKPDGFQFRLLKPHLPNQMEYLLLIENFNCTVRTAPSLATYSNQLYAFKRKIREADLTLKLYDVRTEHMVGNVTVHYSDDNSPPTLRYITTSDPRTGASAWLAKVMDLGLTLLFDNMKE